jgi:hypothetical protein
MTVPPWEVAAQTAQSSTAQSNNSMAAPLLTPGVAPLLAPGVAVLAGGTREDSDAGLSSMATEAAFTQFARSELEGGGYGGVIPGGVNASLMAEITKLYAADKADRG